MAALADLSKGLPGSHAPALAIEGATLIDGTGAAPIPDATVVIENGRITAIGPRPKVKVAPNAHVVDAKEKILLPGLWDMHAHFEQVEWGPIYSRLESPPFATAATNSNYSSLRSGMPSPRDAALGLAS